MNDQQLESFGRREPPQERRRLFALALLVLAVLLIEWWVGAELELERHQRTAASAENWAIADYQRGRDGGTLPAKREGVTRIVYVSNSHAKTGGHVARHLQRLLERLAPGEFEVLDLAEPGIFAPDMLLRTLRAMDYQPDLVLLGVSYISFSDRMGLALQAHSARSFFNPGIASRLSHDFWLRNYDIGIYTDTLASRLSDLYRNRNELRDRWEQPLAHALKRASGDARPSHILELADNTGWRFPEGYDKNLFQWNLYASGRKGHLGDIAELIAALKREEIPLLAFNLPLDLGKSLYSHRPEDLVRYRAEMEALFADALEYVDYQSFFPKEFTTYDALHPTWHGARLHAFDLLLRLAEHRLFREPPSAERLLAVFDADDPALSAEYLAALDGDYLPPKKSWNFRRLELGEPDNARDLLQRVALLTPIDDGWPTLISALAQRIHHWGKERFSVAERPSGALRALWRPAVEGEMGKARERIDHFRRELARLGEERLTPLPLPSLDDAREIASRVEQPTEELRIIRTRYRLADGGFAETARTESGRPFWIKVEATAERPAYVRLDPLGDGSFLLLRSASDSTDFPQWMIDGEPGTRWGY